MKQRLLNPLLGFYSIFLWTNNVLSTYQTFKKLLTQMKKERHFHLNSFVVYGATQVKMRNMSFQGSFFWKMWIWYYVRHLWVSSNLLNDLVAWKTLIHRKCRKWVKATAGLNTNFEYCKWYDEVFWELTILLRQNLKNDLHEFINVKW